MSNIHISSLYQTLLADPLLMDKRGDDAGYGCWTSKEKLEFNTNDLQLFISVLHAYINKQSLTEDKLLTGLKLAGSHAGKLNSTDSKVKICEMTSKKVIDGTLTSRNFPIAQSLFGNAASIPEGRLFTWRFIYNNKLTSLLTLMHDEPAVLLALFPNRTVSKTDIDSIPTNTDLTDDEPQILWPMSDGTYISLTPLPSVSVVECFKHYRDLVKSANDNTGKKPSGGFKRDYINVVLGGTKPQNAGFIMSRCGTFPALASTLSYRKKPYSVLYYPNSLYKQNVNLVINMDFMDKLPNRKKDAYVEQATYVAVKQCICKLLSLKSESIQEEINSPEYRFVKSICTAEDLDTIAKKIYLIIKTPALSTAHHIIYKNAILDYLRAL